MVRLSVQHGLIAAASVALVAVVQASIDATVGPVPPLIFFVPAVTFASWVGGLGPGLLALVLSTLICCELYFPPIGSLVVASVDDQLLLVAFWLQGIMVSYLMGSPHSAPPNPEEDGPRAGGRGRRRDEWLRHALPESPTALFCVKDADGRYQAANQACEDVLGRRGRSVVGRTDFELFPSDVAEASRSEDLQVLASGRTIEREFQYPREDATHTYWMVKSPVPHPTESRGAVGCLAIDVTERTTASGRRKDGEEQFRAMADSMPQLAATASADGRAYWFSKRWHDYTGTSPDEMYGWGWQSVLDPREAPEVLRLWKGSLASGEPFDMQLSLRGADGVYRKFRSRVASIKDERGRVVRWVGVHTDVTEFGRSEEARSRLAAIVDSSQDAIIGTDLEGGVTSWNSGAERLFGYASAEVVGADVAVIIPEDRLGDVGRILALLRRGVRIGRFETVGRRRDGRPIDVALTVSPIRDASGRITGASGIARDVTERKRTEEALRTRTNLYAMLSQMNRSVNRSRSADQLYREVCEIAWKSGGSTSRGSASR